jgi:tryptophanyl-tRNA synthetase
VEVKDKLAAAINSFLDPMRERRAEYASRTGFVDEVIYNGTLRMREEARLTLSEVRKASGLGGIWNGIRRKAEKSIKKRAVES